MLGGLDVAMFQMLQHSVGWLRRCDARSGRCIVDFGGLDVGAWSWVLCFGLLCFARCFLLV